MFRRNLSVSGYRALVTWQPSPDLAVILYYNGHSKKSHSSAESGLNSILYIDKDRPKTSRSWGPSDKESRHHLSVSGIPDLDNCHFHLCIFIFEFLYFLYFCIWVFVYLSICVFVHLSICICIWADATCQCRVTSASDNCHLAPASSSGRKTLLHLDCR